MAGKEIRQQWYEAADEVPQRNGGRTSNRTTRCQLGRVVLEVHDGGNDSAGLFEVMR